MPKAREHGQGALSWDASRQFWRAVIDVGFDPVTGARRQKARSSRTKEGAVKKLNQMLRERDTMGMVLDRSTRVRELAEVWLKDVSERARPHTLSNYRSHVKGNILPILGDRIAADLSPADIRRLHAAMRRKGRSDATVSGAHRTLVSILEHARAERIIADNIAALNPPRRTRPSKTRSSLTRDEARALLSLEDARWTLALLTGLRSGEARALRWSDIDLDAGVAQLFMVPRSAPGLKQGQIHDKVGLRLVNNAEVVLENCRIPKGNLLGEIDSAVKSRSGIIGENNVLSLAIKLGIARSAFEDALAHARERVQGGTPIIEHQAVGLKLAEANAQVEAIRSMVYRLAWMGDNPEQYDRKFASLATWFGVEATFRAVMLAFEVGGCRAAWLPYPGQKHVRDALVYFPNDGTHTIHLLRAHKLLQSDTSEAMFRPW